MSMLASSSEGRRRCGVERYEISGELVEKAFCAVLEKASKSSSIYVDGNFCSVTVPPWKFTLKKLIFRNDTGLAVIENGRSKESYKFKPIELLYELIEKAVTTKLNFLEKEEPSSILLSLVKESREVQSRIISDRKNQINILNELHSILETSEDEDIVTKVRELKSNYEELVSNGVIKLPTVITRVEIGGKILLVDEKGNVYENR
jgi:hypothetical protein